MARVGSRLRAAIGWDEPGPGHYRRAVGAVARGRREQIAVPVGDADIGRVGLWVRIAEARAKGGTGPAEIAWRRHLGRGTIRADQLPALGGVFRGDQSRQ